MSTALKQFEKVSTWSSGEQRAPHKPLLILVALGKLQQRQQILLPFKEIESLLKKLLIEFGPTRKSYHPEYPFWALQHDNLWVLQSESPICLRKGSSNPSRSELLRKKALGSLDPKILDILKRKPEQIPITAKRILTAHFPDSLHEDLANAVGINLVENLEPMVKARRDPKFREQVLVAYEYKCAVCGMDMRLGSGSNSITIGLDAAHIKWHQAGGPNSTSNGLALCSLHHKLLDHGAYTIMDDFRILVSERAHGSNCFNELLLNFHGQSLKKPIRREYQPEKNNLAWHREQVFKPNGRELN